MSLNDKNRMLEILTNRGVCRKHIEKIMKDLNESGLFDGIEDCDDFELVDEESNIFFNNMSYSEKEIIFDKMKLMRDNAESNKIRDHNMREAEKRVQEKIKEMEEKGLREPDEEDRKIAQRKNATRYGRNPLHEAIAMRDIRLVRKYAKNKIFINAVDNNGHTPIEMAYYEGYKEALSVFRSNTG